MRIPNLGESCTVAITIILNPQNLGRPAIQGHHQLLETHH